MKKLLMFCFCLVSLCLLSQEKPDCLLTYNKKTARMSFNIPAESDFDAEKNFYVKFQKQSIVGITFYKTFADSNFYYASVKYNGNPTLDDLLFDEISPKHAFKPDFYKCTKENNPTFVIDRSGEYTITLTQKDVIKKYKLTIDLKPKENYYDGKKSAL